MKDEWNFFGFSVDATKEKISIFVNEGHIPFTEQESNDFVLNTYDWILPLFTSGKIILGSMNISLIFMLVAVNLQHTLESRCSKQVRQTLFVHYIEY